MRLTPRPALVPALAPVLVVAALLGPAPPARADYVDCTSTEPSGQPVPTRDPSRPLQLLGMDRVHARLAESGRAPGAGQVVAVVDSGISPRATAVDVVASHRTSQRPEVLDPHGTIVAGLVAGAPRGPGGELPVGVAWGADVVDVKVYDTTTPTDDSEDALELDNVVEGLTWVADNAGRLGVTVVNVSLEFPAGRDEPLERAVRRLVEQDVVVVAASGNRPTEPTHPLAGVLELEPGEPVPAGPALGEDVAGRVVPAAYDGVVAVSSTADGSGSDDPTAAVLRSSDVDVAVPTAGAISYGADGGSCGLVQIATSWAAAEVSGLVALLRAAYPRDSAAQVVARLVETASGDPDRRTVLTGAGVVQPHEALVRPLRPDEQGRLPQSRPDDRDGVRATAPEPAVDVLAGTRDQAVWWGLLGGGALLLALVLRPVLARRRDRAR